MDDRVHRLKPRSSPPTSTFAIKPDNTSNKARAGFMIKPGHPSNERPMFMIKPDDNTRPGFTIKPDLPSPPHPGFRIKPSTPTHPPGTFVIGKAEAIQEAKERALVEKQRRKEEKKEKRERMWEKVKEVVASGGGKKVKELEKGEKRGSVSEWEWE